MARAIHKLNDLTVRRVTKAGRLADGGNLFLRISGTGGKSWSFKADYKGQRFELGIGPYPAVGLASARSLAAIHRQALAKGIDPRNVPEESHTPTFAICVDEFLSAKESEWSNAKHRAQWRSTLAVYCKPISTMLIDEIDLPDVLKCLKPIWNEKPETASRVRGRIESVLNYAKTMRYRSGENPATWRGNLQNVLPNARKLSRGHHPSMPYENIPALLNDLRHREAIAARALELCILTTCRSSEVLNAKWSEIDLEARMWVIPANRMKARLDHSVPLNEAMLAILQPLNDSRINEWVFIGQKRGQPLSNMAMLMLMKRMKIEDATTHGFRSSFRNWAAERSSFHGDIAEMCLAHKVGSAVQQAYLRSDLMDKRRALLNAWSEFCSGHEAGKVVKLHG